MNRTSIKRSLSEQQVNDKLSWQRKARFVGLVTLLVMFVGVTSLVKSLSASPVPGYEKEARARLKPASQLEPKSEEIKVSLPKFEAEVVPVGFSTGGKIELGNLPTFSNQHSGEFVAHDQHGNGVFFTPRPALQDQAIKILEKYNLPWGAIVAVEPATGRILTMASHSTKEPFGETLALRGTFPAASLFKIVTAAAAIEKGGVSPHDGIRFRGGNYTLNKWNYKPSVKHDRRIMSFVKALGKSCNPVFGRLGLNYFPDITLGMYAENFGFNNEVDFSLPVEISEFVKPQTEYQRARTAAGFGPVTISPLHAAMVMAAIANEGKMMKPLLVDRVLGFSGGQNYLAQEAELRSIVTPATAKILLEMLQSTVESGTARRTFKRRRSILRDINISAKTGTLSGKQPKGRYHWFIAAAPVEKPELALAALVIDPGNARINGTGIGKEFLEFYFKGQWKNSPAK